MAKRTANGLVIETFGSEDDPPVVLVHGIGQSRHVWRGAAAQLALAGRFAITYDLRGHGESAPTLDGDYGLDVLVSDLRAVLATLPSRAVLVGASVGGWIAAVTIGEGETGCAAGLVLVDASPWIDPEASAATGALLRSHAEGFDSLEKAAAAASQLHPARAEKVARHLDRRLRSATDGRLHWSWDTRAIDSLPMQIVMERVPAALARIDVPVLAVRGAESQIVSAEAHARLLKLTPSAELVEIENAGHLIVSDDSDGFSALLLEFLERRVPRAPIAYETGADARTLRDALGCFSTGITVVTTVAADGTKIGLTANSFTAVSLDPPLILVCLANNAASRAIFETASHFAINVLHIGQQPVSTRFASRVEDRFAATPHEFWDSGVPMISNALASFECARYEIHEGGDHTILIGRVLRAQFEPRRDPLLYFRGKYRRLHFA